MRVTSCVNEANVFFTTVSNIRLLHSEHITGVQEYAKKNNFSTSFFSASMYTNRLANNQMPHICQHVACSNLAPKTMCEGTGHTMLEEKH
jgi:hypothetical protein